MIRDLKTVNIVLNFKKIILQKQEKILFRQ